MQFQSIWFDLDGTLSNSGPGIMDSVRYAADKLDLRAPTQEELRSFVGPPLYASFRRVFGLEGVDVERAVQAYREHYEAEGILHSDLYPGIPALLSQLRQAGKRLYVCTTKPEPFARIVLERCGITGCFEAILGGSMDESLLEKDRLMAALAARFSPPAPGVMVGDRKFDLMGASALGMPALGVLWGYGDRAELEACQPWALAETPEQAAQALLKGDAV